MRDHLQAAILYVLAGVAAVTLLVVAVALLGALVCVLLFPFLCFWTIYLQCRRLCRPGFLTIVLLVTAGITSVGLAFAVAHANRWPGITVVILGPAFFLVMGNLVLLGVTYCVLHPHVMKRLAASRSLRSEQARKNRLSKGLQAAKADCAKVERCNAQGLRAWQRREKWMYEILKHDPRGLAAAQALAEKRYASMATHELRQTALAETRPKRNPVVASLNVTLAELEEFKRTLGPVRDRHINQQHHIRRLSADLASTDKRVASLRKDYEKAVNRLQVAASPRIRLP